MLSSLGRVKPFFGHARMTAASMRRSRAVRPCLEMLEGRALLTAPIITLATFDGTNGAGSIPIVLDAAGNIYGITSRGGASNFGTVFEVTSGSGTITTLAYFDGTNGIDGDNPQGDLEPFLHQRPCSAA